MFFGYKVGYFVYLGRRQGVKICFNFFKVRDFWVMLYLEKYLKIIDVGQVCKFSLFLVVVCICFFKSVYCKVQNLKFNECFEYLVGIFNLLDLGRRSSDGER